MASRQPHYSPKQVAQALRASESSVKRWCDSGAIPIVKTVGGHRRITLDGLQQYLRGSGRSLLQPEVLGLPMLGPGRLNDLPGDEEPGHARFRAALATGDETTCRDILKRRIDSIGVRSEAAEGLITDAMHGMGEAWSCQEVDAYQERRGCGICLRLINELRAELPPPESDAPIAIGGSPSGDPYQLPTALVELALREVGWNAVSLGSNLPLESFRQAAHDHRPQLVWLSVSVIDNPATFIAQEIQLAGQLGEDVALLVGGRALTDQVRPKLRYTAYCDSVRHLSELAAVMFVS